MSEKREEFIEVTNKLIKWLRKNGHPHMTIIVTQTSAELLEGQMAHSTEQKATTERREQLPGEEV